MLGLSSEGSGCGPHNLVPSGAIWLLHESYELQHPPLISSSRVKAKWQRPPLGFMKINLGGGPCRAARGIRGIGIVAHDHEGTFLACKLVAVRGSPTFACKITTLKGGAFVCPKMA
ncbi:unnamed protein product [Prunus armeniaca]|uniref:RNase H type-1 domain-containing protein n=1 Tax=Prunus armeniaca TaxID=36596 RepID=A0A6J5X858_PRUAR|nr:unnamed protein product [Prunus armeniaca]